jgi:hypothetical protein
MTTAFMRCDRDRPDLRTGLTGGNPGLTYSRIGRRLRVRQALALARNLLLANPSLRSRINE